MKLVSKIKNNLFIFFTFVCGVAFRVYFGLNADPSISQHDVIGEMGHFEYAKYIFKNGKLPMSNDWQFYQPPFNAFMQSMMMKISKLLTGSKNVTFLYRSSNILAIFYTIIALIFMYLILKKLCKNQFVIKFTFLILAIYPGFIFMATQYNNDPPAFMFFFISLYFGIKWMMSKKIFDIIILAISIGIGMLTKISVGLIAFIIGPMMLLVLFKDKKVFSKLIVFALIVFPLGLSYVMRNYILFGQSISYVPHITAEAMQVGGFSFIDRFLSFPLDRLFFGKYSIYHDIREYNIWVDLIKTATFDETIYLGTEYHIPCIIILILNFAFYVLSFIATIYAIYKLFIKKKINITKQSTDIKNVVKINDTNAFDTLSGISLLLILVSTISYIAFNISHPVSCTSSYRYVSYATFAYAYLLGFMIYDIIFRRKKKV